MRLRNVIDLPGFDDVFLKRRFLARYPSNATIWLSFPSFLDMITNGSPHR